MWDLPRLEALVAKQPSGILGSGPRKKWDNLLRPLRRAEHAYHTEWDAYLWKVEEEANQQTEALLSKLPKETIQQIAKQTGAPADWRQWSAELKAAVVQAILKSQKGGE